MEEGIFEGPELQINAGQKTGNDKAILQKVGQEQIHSLLFGNQLSWQAIIYDLINTEQLDPWDINLVLLSNRYLEKIKELEEANLFVSSKVLFAAALLLRMKSEILLNHFIPSLDDILFGRTEKKKYEQERIELDEEVPGLYPRSPLPRFRKVTLQELMSALGKAITTENRRIKRVILGKQQEIETAIAMPRRKINIQEKIVEIYNTLKKIFTGKEEKVAFNEIAGADDKKRVETFIPLLYLDTQHKIFLEQEGHLEEIWVWLKYIYEDKNKEELERLKKEVEIALMEEELEEKQYDEEKEERLKKMQEARKKKLRNKIVEKAKDTVNDGEEDNRSP